MVKRNTAACVGILGALVFIVAGCASVDYRTMSAAEIFAVGQAHFDSEKWNRAQEAFERLKDLHPFSTRVTAAELRIAQCMYHRREYPEAIVALEEFLVRHPTHEELPGAVYYLGLSHYERMLSIDRDQAATRLANQQFQRLVTRYADSRWAELARTKLEDTRHRLAKRERYVARFYLRRGEYYAALGRYLTVIEDYPDTVFLEEALYHAARCEIRLDEPAEVRRLLTQMVSRFPDGDYADRGRALLDELEADEE